VFLPKISFNGEYREMAVASSTPPRLNPSAFIQPRFANSHMMPALAIMNLMVWSLPPTFCFMHDLRARRGVSLMLLLLVWPVIAELRGANSNGILFPSRLIVQRCLYSTSHSYLTGGSGALDSLA
jgi:hypothetical protein